MALRRVLTVFDHIESPRARFAIGSDLSRHSVIKDHEYGQRLLVNTFENGILLEMTSRGPLLTVYFHISSDTTSPFVQPASLRSGNVMST